MKISILNQKTEVLDKAWEGKPFSLTKDRWEYTLSYEESDYILCPLDYLNVNNDFKKIISTDEYKKYGHKFVSVFMHDDPHAAYLEKKSIKINCQPLYPSDTNQAYNNIIAPLHMRHFDYELQKDKALISFCRSAEKKYDFVFIGQVAYANRGWLASLNGQENFLYRETNPIFGISDLKIRVDIMKDFCADVAQAKYSFCPRGIGTSSFRLYQSLMVGSIPIVWGQKEYPFSNRIDWNKIVIDITNNIDCKNDVLRIIESISENQYFEMREAGIEAWDNYLSCEKADQAICDILESKL